MIDYKSYVETVILRGTFVLSEMEDKINKLWVEGKLTDADREALLPMAAEHADDVFQINVLERLAKVEQDIYELKFPTDIYPIYERGQTSIKGQVYRADVTGDGEYDLVRYDGGRQSTSLSIGKIEGWHLLSRELEVVATISKDADGNYVIEPIEPEPEPVVDESESIEPEEG
jgi:hypothetical protein